mgnify:CR=1 FL=1
MTLRARLVLAFLALALVPLAILALFTYAQMDFTLQRMNSRGVDSTLRAAG